MLDLYCLKNLIYNALEAQTLELLLWLKSREVKIKKKFQLYYLATPENFQPVYFHLNFKCNSYEETSCEAGGSGMGYGWCLIEDNQYSTAL